MRRVFFKIAGLFIAGLVSSACDGTLPGGKPNFAYIEGVVTDSITGSPISGVVIEVSHNGEEPDTGDMTDSDGKYSVRNTGTVIVATKRGYETYYASLNTINRAATVTYNISLTPGSAEDTTPPAAPITYFVFPADSDIYWISTDPSEVAGYIIYRDGTPMYTTFFTVSSDGGVTAGTHYCYSIAAFDASGNESPRSGEMCYTALSNVYSPGGPYSIGLTVSSSSELAIRWAVDEIRPCNIYRDGILVKSLAAGEGASPQDWRKISYSDSGLSPGVKYCYSITEVKAGGETEPTSPVCAATWPN